MSALPPVIPERLRGDGIGSISDLYDHARDEAADRLEVILDAHGCAENRLDYLDLAMLRLLRTSTAEQLIDLAAEELGAIAESEAAVARVRALLRGEPHALAVPEEP